MQRGETTASSSTTSGGTPESSKEKTTGTVRASGRPWGPCSSSTANDNYPQSVYQSAPAQDHHNENAPPPHILPAPQVV
jgi:hypothetical protein